MADPRALAGLLDRANQVFSLAGKLGRAFEEDRQEQGMLVSSASWKNHAATFDEFSKAVLGLRDEMQSPPEGFETVAPQLLKAAKIAKGIRDSVRSHSPFDFPYYLDFYLSLNSVDYDGYQAVKAVKSAQRLDDPFAFLDEPKTKPSVPAGGGRGGDAVGEVPTAEQYAGADAILQVARGGGGVEASGKASIAAFFNAFRDAMQMTKGYLADKVSGKPTDWPQQEFDAACGVSAAARSELERLTGKPTGWLNGLLDDLQRASRLPADECRAFARVLDDYELALYRGLRQARCDVGEPAATPEVSPQVTPTPTVEPKKKRSTERGEGRAKLIAALTKHHKYADGSCLNQGPIGNNELAQLSEVSTSTASTFFNDQFNDGKKGGHTKYRAACGDITQLVAALKLLNNEYAPHHLFGSAPPGETEPEDED